MRTKGQAQRHQLFFQFITLRAKIGTSPKISTHKTADMKLSAQFAHPEKGKFATAHGMSDILRAKDRTLETQCLIM
jgi:hypothetical protein